MFETVITENSMPQTVIKALYRYYERPENQMTVVEMYLMLRLIVSKIEDELEKMGFDIESKLSENALRTTPTINH